ncbi:MAG: hypothetical protein RRB22_08120 [Gammaproteobacteria bacterium]|nr:hypothetical protein [Gammaproteobacteria bacterium]
MFTRSFSDPITIVRIMPTLLAVSLLASCKTIESSGLHDYSNGIHMAVAKDAQNPAYVIGETMGAAGYGYAYLLEKTDGRWRVMYDSYDAKAFAKTAGDVKEVPADTEVLWTDGKEVVAYFGTQALSFSRIDGSFGCPKDKALPGHRACRSLLTRPNSVFDGLSASDGNRPYVLDFEAIQQAVADTGIVGIAKNRLAREK